MGHTVRRSDQYRWKLGGKTIVSLIHVADDLVMPKSEVDAYLAKIEEPKKSTLAALRKTILEIIPNAEECISYGMPAYKINGKAIAGFAAFKNHCSYFPHSGSVLELLEPEIAKYPSTKGALHFPIDKPLAKALVRKLIKTRMDLEAAK